MLKNSRKDQIEEIICSLDNLHKVEAPAFFYTKVLSRLGRVQHSSWDIISNSLSRPIVAFACVCMIILLNLFAAISHTSNISRNSTEVVSSDDYSQATNSFYDLENNKP